MRVVGRLSLVFANSSMIHRKYKGMKVAGGANMHDVMLLEGRYNLLLRQILME
jgi:hypothetical protein